MKEYPIKISKSNNITDRKVLTKYAWIFSLGDGCLMSGFSKNRPNKNVNAFFGCGQLADNEDYILWRADILSNITSVYLQCKSKDRRPQIDTITGHHPFFTTLRSRMYLNGHKVVDPHDLKLLDWEALAILYQDDGCLSKKPKGNNCYTLSLSTESFSYGEQVMLQRAIKDKTDILFRIGSIRTKGGLHYILVISKYDSIVKFLDGVKPFIKPSFEYKLLSGVQYPFYSRQKTDDETV